MSHETISHYRVLDKLGEGGMGRVFRAVDARLGRTVAVKVVNAAFTQRFEREARAIAALNHPHICTLHDVGEHEGAPFLVMEFVEGKPLHGPLPVDEALGYAIQIAHALAAAHKAGIVHRDLKPDNILLTAEGSVKILDFGLAKLHQTAPEALKLTTMTEQGTIAGTGPYMSPEQAQGEAVDARSDIFSFGAVLYELLSGRRAFARETFQATLVAVVAMEPEPLREAPPTVARIVAKMLAKEREKRYQRAGDLLKDLEAAAREKPWWQTRRAVISMAATPVALAGAALGFNVRGWRTQLMNWMEPPAAAAIRLAVMPFVNMTGDPEQEYFSDGITQELISQLGSLHPSGLNVIGNTSVMRYKNTSKSLEEVAQELKVEYLLGGSARREGGRARITTELIRARDQIQLWAETFDREISGILVLQSEVARKVAGALALKLLPAEQARAARTRLVDPEAYENYLKGVKQWQRFTPEDGEIAMKYFEASLAKDPDYAPAHLGVGMVRTLRWRLGQMPPGGKPDPGYDVLARALELDPELPQVHRFMAGLRVWHEWDWAGGEASFKRALELDASYAEARAYYGHLLMVLKRPREAEEQLLKAIDLDPFNPLWQAFYARFLNSSRRHDEALARIRTALRSVPDMDYAREQAIHATHFKYLKGEVEDVLAEFQAIWGNDPLAEVFARGFKAGGYEEGWRQVAEFRVAEERERGWQRVLRIFTLYLFAGDRAKALDWLEKAYEVRDWDMPYAFSGAETDQLQSEPRFQALRRKMNLPA
ncbi:MAG: protein kinase [Bryobacteraceae bacterium]|nr:protein kinase [Bryobacteraceae bacterium]